MEWNVQTLAKLLKPVVARRNAVQADAKGRRSNKQKNTDLRIHREKTQTRPLDEVEEVIRLPVFDQEMVQREADPNSIALEPRVIAQLRQYVTVISNLYHDNAFHNFEHASHVASSVEKLLKRIVAPEDMDTDDPGTAKLGLNDFS